ncbi:YHS domain-containing protein [Exilibacterium tricleocarpae]|uniref:YHS domain-containing protein n=1 Tax=Exilibacterium tricleocarpae TaxID=2591008 RepID=A0A545TAF0_9GAMM|nr:YHS domain-containing (seleno)protein [Exilibacterium tricleocarpae]TQV74188.1 YHS domain-containing protein [Exilibacterium tricleocarpae]
MVFKKFCVVVIALYAAVALAADPPFYSHKSKGAIKGADVVAYFDLEPGARAVMGKDEFVYEWKGATWKFASAENRDKFSRDPEAYAPQYGGYCAFSVSRNFTTSIRPNSWTIIDGKLYLNYNNTSMKKFLKDPAAMVQRADGNWPGVLKNCEKRGNCR